MEIPTIQRNFIAANIVLSTFEDIKPYYDELLSREITSIDAYKDWLSDISELDAFLDENVGWRYIKMTIDTTNETFAQDYNTYVSTIQPKLAPLDNALHKKIVASTFLEALSKDKAYEIYFRSIQVSLDLYREENISIEAYLNEKSQEYGNISGAQEITYEEKSLTMQQAALHLKSQDVRVRKEVFEKMAGRRSEDFEKLNALYSDLILKRHQLALNAGFENYRDYMFAAMGRFDYTKEDCFEFHASVESLVVPMVREIQQKKLDKLGQMKFKPWDLDVDPDGNKALKPFESGKEMLEKTIDIFTEMDSYFGACLTTMEKMNHLDLESKTGKAPGGYNYPLYEIGVPFIFMNAVGSHRDLVTMVHEGGHAIHSFLNRDLTLTAFKDVPSEGAELASMSMELLSMKYWGRFYQNPDDAKRAKREHLEDILMVLPWVAQIDAFQHWIYTHPEHTFAERNDYWLGLSKRFGTGLTDWSGFEENQKHAWQKQLHLYEVPFYYIEYGIAQIGALGVWKNSIEDEAKALAKYKEGLSLGYTQGLKSIYETSGVPFDFTLEQIKSLMGFVQKELSTCQNE